MAPDRTSHPPTAAIWWSYVVVHRVIHRGMEVSAADIEAANLDRCMTCGRVEPAERVETVEPAEAVETVEAAASTRS
jgi:hypothetical protein